MAKCRICSIAFEPGKSRELCDRHYWQVRRLAERTPEDLDHLERKAELTKACIEVARHKQDDSEGEVA